MRKLLIVLMLLLMPLQSAWSLAAGVCEHETGQTSHFGHHEHEHEGGDSGDGAPPGGFHADCGVCQGVGAAMFGAGTLPPGRWPGLAFAAFQDTCLPDPPVEALLRPPLLVG